MNIKKNRKGDKKMEPKIEKTKVYKPKMFSQDDMTKGLKECFSTQREQQQKPKQGTFGAKPMGFGQQKPMSFGEQPQGQNPMNIPNVWGPKKTNQTSLDSFGLTMQKPQPQQKPEPPEEPKGEQPYWTSQEWEQYFLDVYEQYPEVRKYLPDWFVEAIEEEK